MSNNIVDLVDLGVVISDNLRLSLYIKCILYTVDNSLALWKHPHPHNRIFISANNAQIFISANIISTDEDQSLRIESSAIINLRDVFTKLNYYCNQHANV